MNERKEDIQFMRSMKSNASKDSSNSLSFIDLFAGCGGLSLGLLNAGWKGLFAAEKSQQAFKTFQHNLLERKLVGEIEWPPWLPQKKMSIEVMLSKYREELVKLSTDVDLVAGGPPCQGFSMAGMRKSNDPRNRLVHRFLDVVGFVKPSLVLMENVEGINNPFKKGKKVEKKQAPADKLEKKLASMGYTSTWVTLKASRFGVAQSRSRLFLIAASSSLLTGWSEVDFLRYLERARIEFLEKKGLSLKKSISVKAAISDLETMNECGGKERTKIQCVDSPTFEQVKYNGSRTKYQRILREKMGEIKKAPNSMRLVKHREKTLQRYQELLDGQERGIDLSSVLLEKYSIKKHNFAILDPDKPAPTITSIPDDFIHYCEPRVLTVRELARIQSFPDWFAFLGKYTTGGHRRRKEVPRYTQVANAVPPFIAEVIGLALKRYYTDVKNGAN